MIALKDYQERSLDALRDYLRVTAQTGDPAGAFGEITRRQFQEAVKYLPVSVAGLGSRMPYVCLRIPTGGGRTLFASVHRLEKRGTARNFAAVTDATNPAILCE